MAGLNTIIDHIKQEADSNVNAILKEAQDFASALKADTEKKLSAEVDRINKKCESELKSIAERSISSSELKKKQIALSCKQELIMETIEKAKEKLINLNEKEYADFVWKVYEKNVPTKDCVIKFSKKDLDNAGLLKLGFEELASKNGAKVTISNEPANIKSGFILDFGGIVGNCSFESLIDQNIDKLIDKINKKLFD